MAAETAVDNEQNPHHAKNSALIFIKPHANIESVQKLVKTHLQEHMVITFECDIAGSRIDRKKLIDQHYYTIANKATILKPDSINVPKEKFEKFFKESWSTVLSEGRTSNALDACERFQCDAAALDAAWRKAESENKVAKFGGGFYCGLMTVNDKPPLYVFNAFFMTMRQRYVDPESSIHCFVVEWKQENLSWKDFRGKVLGGTDPVTAEEGSLRRILYERWEELGLGFQPTKGDNGVHGSASPLEGLTERVNWLSKDIFDDRYGKILLSRGLRAALLEEWSKDPQVSVPPSGQVMSLFDYVEDTDADDCMEKLVGVYDYKLSLIKNDEEGCKCGCPVQ
mmetsp:Transcript_3296/g.4226  ORF Transcript_3296/g.4226 Transcript_3296/m.4226 type:complete len:339 (+) Transcript_3296:117-1133(+)|eukprot:CAMPEP_0172487574 /NCGR_PEP_ID=MMETSP1066-20121228/16715_1 /TAXON_ID=671091 /ORGANISM="Coscinodiscus wailesii, Strain CCMP2513" /LENGTH=338 /DNA_ID=CAMNT_0013254271 /DNA_START=130 /DNA_END=1146 /DNA_ORIENTATION=-